MPSAAARRLYEDQIPSFMSVFDLDPATLEDRGTITVVDPNMITMDPSSEPKRPTRPNQQQHLRPDSLAASDPSHKHNDSTSTQNSESPESSPTTTVSCTDSSSLSDPSPSSSPDSPVNLLLPLSSYPATSFAGLGALGGAMANLAASDTQLGRPLGRPMTSPAPRRPKNMKGLSIQPPFMGNVGAASLVSEPSSPSFIKPVIPAMKRKPSQLSLRTNSSDLLGRTTVEIPQSPSVAPILQRRALKHSTSSPHMLAGLRSAMFGPVGGMTIPTVLERNESGLSEFMRPSKGPPPATADSTTIVEEDSPIRSQIANRSAFDIEPYREHENNEDQKSPAYPEGPIAIYGEDVYLYLEPTAAEAARFDVVINVAREVLNPFDNTSPIPDAAAIVVRPPVVAQSPIPDTAMTAASYATAFEFPPEDATPTTPKAPVLPPEKRPEYIHMPWDHNTDIAEDLMTLCGIMEKRAREGKKVLVHCQQGASRSASLIIAYGIYTNPDRSVNDAYHAAQAKSRWISPNMRLMYCLQDFHKEVQKQQRRQSAGAGLLLRSRAGRSPTKHRITLSADAIETSSPKEPPLTAPLMSEDGSARSGSPDRRNRRPRGNTTPGSQPISPGPSSAPSSFSWTEKEDENDDAGRFGRFHIDEVPTTASPSPPSDSRCPDSGFASPSSLELLPLKLPDPFSRPPPPSPGFGHHRFGSETPFGFAPLSLGGAPVRDEQPHPVDNLAAAAAAAAANGPEGSQGTKKKKKKKFTAVLPSFPDGPTLMSPRAETMTNNPLHQSFPDLSGMTFVESPPTPGPAGCGGRLFSPRETMFPRAPFYPFVRPTQIADPRSPPTKGEMPIVRSIDEIL